MRKTFALVFFLAVTAFIAMPALAVPPPSGPCSQCCEWACSDNAWCTTWQGSVVNCYNTYGRCAGSGNCNEVFEVSADSELEILEAELFQDEQNDDCKAPPTLTEDAQHEVAESL